MKFIFMIETLEKDSVFVVVAVNLEEACQKMHKHLLAGDPTTWSSDWRDLLDDVQEGNQMCYGPYAEIPTID